MTSIVMISRGRYRLLEQALNSLLANTEGEFSLTIVSDDETDFRCTKLLRSIQRKNYTLLEVSGSSHVLSQLKNLGVAWSEQRFARGDWLYLSDSDVCFTPGWLEKLTELAAMSEPQRFRLWGGQIHPFHQGMECPNFVATEHSILDGPSWLMRWETWDKYGPFDRTTAPGVCQSEEYPWCERLTAGGGRIGVIHPHVIFHCGITQTDGKPAPGAEERLKNAVPGVLYL